MIQRDINNLAGQETGRLSAVALRAMVDDRSSAIAPAGGGGGQAKRGGGQAKRGGGQAKRGGRQAKAWALLGILVSALLLSCAPATISRIGPSRTPKPPGCPVEVLDPGVSPDRPIVDIGVVALQNCQDYNAGPCIKWLKKAACELGGEVAYLPDPTPPKDEFDATNYRVLVAVYTVSTLDDLDEACKEHKEQEEEASETERCME